MDVPMLDLFAQYELLRADTEAAVRRVLESQHFIMGPEVAAFEREIGEYLEVPHALGVSSGTDALLLALMALGVGPGDEVVTTPFTFFATAGCVSRLGARPVFVDIEPDTFNIDPSRVAAAITPRTKAIIPVHLFGQSADLDALTAAAGGLPLIEDAAQAVGARWNGARVGSVGAVGCFSFFPSKNLGGAGDGGLVTAKDPELAERMRVLRVHGAKPKYHHHYVGGNFRLDELQAAILRVKLPHLEGWHAARAARAARYDALLAGLPVQTPTLRAGATTVWNQYTVRIAAGDGTSEFRDRVQARLDAAGVATAVYYPIPLHLQACFADLGHGPGDFPASERAAHEVLSLPVHPDLTDAQQDYVVEKLGEAVAAG